MSIVLHKITPDIVRTPGWESRLSKVLTKELDRPFAWGDADCIDLVCKDVEALTEWVPIAPSNRRWKTELGALHALEKLGFPDVGAAMAYVFPPVERLRARRGDLGILEQVVSGTVVRTCAVVLGSTAAARSTDGKIVVPLSMLSSTYRVGW